jgi:hypothetical protein
MISAQTRFAFVAREKPLHTFPDHTLKPCSPNANVKRALPTMADMRFLKSDHERAEFRLAEPLRHLAAQYASLGPRAHLALAGDDKDKSEAIEMRALQENRECVVRMRLRHPVQVEPCFDIAASAQEFRTFAAAKRR